MERLYFLEGRFLEVKEAKARVEDISGLLHGRAVFETIRTYDRRPFALEEHLVRLRRSAERIGAELPLSLGTISRKLSQGIELLGKEALIRLFLVAGDSGAFFFMLFEPLSPIPPELYEQGVRLLPVDFPRPFPEVKRPFRLEAWLARAGDKTAWEVLYCPDGRITEAETSNFFLVLDEKNLVTAPTSMVLPGVTRGIVIELAGKTGMTIEERCPRVGELAVAREAFITGSVKEILPVVEVGDRRIGDGVPGEVTRRLLQAYREEVRRRMER